jgi:hypothetical protein
MKIDDLIREFRATAGEPLWKMVLNWGTVLVFFALPIAAFTGLLHPERLEYLREYMRNITLLVFGLAGLKTWESIKYGNGKQTEK